MTQDRVPTPPRRHRRTPLLVVGLVLAGGLAAPALTSPAQPTGLLTQVETPLGPLGAAPADDSLAARDELALAAAAVRRSELQAAAAAQQRARAAERERVREARAERLARAERQAAQRRASRSGERSTTTAPSAPVSPGSARAIARDQLAARGQADQFGCLDNLWTKESGWRTTAGSASGAYGIPQALPGRKMASAGADWRTNPATQIRWGLGYISARYGDPCGAWSHFQNRGWY